MKYIIPFWLFCWAGYECSKRPPTNSYQWLKTPPARSHKSWYTRSQMKQSRSIAGSNGVLPFLHTIAPNLASSLVRVIFHSVAIRRLKITAGMLHHINSCKSRNRKSLKWFFNITIKAYNHKFNQCQQIKGKRKKKKINHITILFPSLPFTDLAIKLSRIQNS